MANLHGAGGDQDDAVETELLERTRVQHRNWGGGGGVTRGGPRVEGEERSQRTQAEERHCTRRGGQRGIRRRETFEQCGEGRVVPAEARHLHRNQDATQRKHRAHRQVDRHLHGRRPAPFAAPEERQDERGDQREFVEEVEADNIIGREHGERAAEHE